MLSKQSTRIIRTKLNATEHYVSSDGDLIFCRLVKTDRHWMVTVHGAESFTRLHAVETPYRRLCDAEETAVKLITAYRRKGLSIFATDSYSKCSLTT